MSGVGVEGTWGGRGGGGLEYVKTLVFFLSCKSNDKYGRVLDGRCDDVQGSKEEGKGVTGLFLKCGRMRS